MFGLWMWWLAPHVGSGGWARFLGRWWRRKLKTVCAQDSDATTTLALEGLFCTWERNTSSRSTPNSLRWDGMIQNSIFLVALALNLGVILDASLSLTSHMQSGGSIFKIHPESNHFCPPALPSGLRPHSSYHRRLLSGLPATISDPYSIFSSEQPKWFFFNGVRSCPSSA